MNKKLLIALIIVLGIGLTFFGALYFFNEEDDPRWPNPNWREKR